LRRAIFRRRHLCRSESTKDRSCRRK
jgi:hypothetical protein